ncbi:hypothetical protein M0813_27424 [Anaeramoeba flamelloides]|uniref:Uncharacterized protein n=1 Tax=Anaeramoeba flamelloides TaxID=1746091 RepID=A0ABQ8XWD4_9EUKA|nr:hypothetical protein M0813_27424 [Anaeramoeba flamelloides]
MNFPQNSYFKPFIRCTSELKPTPFCWFNNPQNNQIPKNKKNYVDPKSIYPDLDLFQTTNTRKKRFQRIQKNRNELEKYFRLTQIPPTLGSTTIKKKKKINHNGTDEQSQIQFQTQNKENYSPNKRHNEKPNFQRGMFPQLKLKQKQSIDQKIKKKNQSKEKSMLDEYLNRQPNPKGDILHSPNSKKIRRLQPKKPKSKLNDEDIICSLSSLLNQTMKLTNRNRKIDQQKGINLSGSWRVYHSTPIISNNINVCNQKSNLNFEQNLYQIFENISQDFSNFISLRNCNLKNKKVNEIRNDSKLGNRTKQALENNSFQQLSLSINYHNIHVPENTKLKEQEIIPALEFRIKDNQNEQIASLIFCTTAQNKEKQQQERERETKMDLESIKEKQKEKENENENEKKQGFVWIQRATNKSLVIKLPIVLIKVKSKAVLTQIGILDFLAFKYNCLMSRVRFSNLEMGKFLMNWSKRLCAPSNRNRKRKRNPKHNQVDQQQQQLVKDQQQQLKGNLSLNDEKEMETIKFVYHSPAYKSNDIILRLSHLSISKILRSRVIVGDGKNLIQCIHEYFCSLYRINLDNCILNQILFPKFLLNRNGIIRFEKEDDLPNFLTLFNHIIC